MKDKAKLGFLICVAALAFCSAAWAMDEAVLTPTNNKAKPAEEKAFKYAMDVWFKHKYADGEKMLREFAKQNPDSRWRAEADLHVGCYLTYLNRLDDAKSIFDNVITSYPGDIAATKAKIRLGNVAERAGKFDDAIDYYTNSLQMNPTWDQFRYANYRARKLIMTRGKLQSRINCGPVALAACLDSLGKYAEAAGARKLQAGIDGMSLAQLKAEADKLGIRVHPVIMPIQDLLNAKLPLLAHVEPNHYLAITGIVGDKVRVEDSIAGMYETTFDALGKIWSGVVLSFDPSAKEEAVAMAVARETWGGCCGQADDDECLGDCSGECQQEFSGGSGCGGSSGGCSGGNPPSGGSPTWKVNVVNLNLIVKDTPIWYKPGNGPQIAFTLTYSNENSNTGIFGNGWRSPYDMKVFFLPSSDTTHPSLQVHRANGRIETYEWDADAYRPRLSMRNYGYRDTIEKLADGTVVLSLYGGGKYIFMPEGGVAEGRIHYLEDSVGNRVTCSYDSQSGNLVSVVDARNQTTSIETTGSGITERVTKVTIPDGRFALFGYTDGYLTSITDMGTTLKPGYTSTLTYGAKTWSATSRLAYLDQSMTTSSPANGESLKVYTADTYWEGTEGFPSTGAIKVTNGNNEEETITYTGKTLDRFLDITRGSTPINAAIGNTVQGVGDSSVPYLSTIETPSKKTMFTYEWWTLDTVQRPVVALHEIYECAAGENYPTVPTIHYAWCTFSYNGQRPPDPEYTMETHYPTSVTPNGSGCTIHWTGGLTKKYKVYLGTQAILGRMEDCTGSIQDVISGVDQSPTVEYEYDTLRNRTGTKDGNGNETTFAYDSDRNMISRKPPLGGSWTYDYANDLLNTEKDPSGNKVKIYTYNAAGQNTKVETELKPGVRSTLSESWYYTNDSQLQGQPYYTYTTDTSIKGKPEHMVDGRGKSTIYHYNENGETRGFLTSVEDAEGQRTRYYYDASGRRYQVTDANNNTTTYEFDNLDRVVKIINPDSTTVETQYSCCHKEWIKDENGKVTKYEYDVRNRPSAVITAAVDTAITQNIAAGDTQIPLNSTARFPATGTVLLKSSTGDIEIVTYSGINANTITGVARGQFGTTAKAFAATAKATEGNMAVTVYDEDILDGNGNYIHRGILDRKVGLYDPNGHLTQYEYYDNSRLKKTIYPDGTWEQYTYDNAGNMTKKEYGHAAIVTKTVNYSYDANNRLVKTYE